ncbi:MAG: hypothetical protein FJ102_19055 [Deltaproteobacteria bacterium]|nr:hypothetical protein [Deltaproteobacteria bacterium]
MEEGGWRSARRWAAVVVVLLAGLAWWATRPEIPEVEPVATAAPPAAPAGARKPVQLRRPAKATEKVADSRVGEALGRAVTEIVADRAAGGAEGGDQAAPGDDAPPLEMPMAAMRDSIVSGLLTCLSGDGPELRRVDAEITLSLDDAGLAAVDLLFPADVEPPSGFAECATEVYWAEDWPRSEAPSMSTIGVSLAVGGGE